MKNANNIWKFPAEVGIEATHHCLAKLKAFTHNGTITLDLSRTENIHSSFIGFLIHARQVIKKKGGNLVLTISPTLEKIFNMLKISDFLSTICVVETVIADKQD